MTSTRVMAARPRVRDQRAEAVLEAIRTRRVVRAFTDDPVSVDDLRRILESARWAVSAGNRRINKFLVVRDTRTIGLVKAVSPGMLGRPTALIVICTDTEKAAKEQVQLDRDPNTWIDVGTAAMNMMLAAHALGLGSCPATSFSRSGVTTVLELPPTLIPEFIVQLGHPAPQPRVMRAGASTRLTIEALTYWERYGQVMPD
jgi:nitroreductase